MQAGPFISKKDIVLEKLFLECQKQENFVFHNDLVKKISAKVGFGNPFDATKLDNISKLPESFIENDICIIHLGSGYHQFIKGINKVYHEFEPIQKNIRWEYKKSILNQFNSSESNILSVANNQRILHHFLFETDKEFNNVDISKRPKTYFPHRTKTSFEYYFGRTKVNLENIQLEIDLTIEYQGVIGVFEAKNGTPNNFSIYQLYHPFLYYYNANNHSTIQGKIKNIFGVYVVREKQRSGDVLKLWAYTFEKPKNITSIKLVKSAAYQLINQK